MDSTLEASNGKIIKATTVFALCIKFLRDEAMNAIREASGSGGYKVGQIQWVLTVPAICTPEAKQFIREAAYEVIPCYGTLFCDE